MNEEQLGSGEIRINKAFLDYTKKKLEQLEKTENPDINLINKYKNNIKLYEKRLKKLE